MTWDDPRRVTGIGLNRRDYESEKYIQSRTDAFHRTTGRYPTKQEVIQTLKREKTYRLKPPDAGCNKRTFEYRAIVRFAVDELSKLIQSSVDEDPIRIIVRFMSDMDDIITIGETSVVWRFAESMRNAAGDILDLI